MTHKLLDAESHKVIYRSTVRAHTSSTPNHKLESHGGEIGTSSGSSEGSKPDGSPIGETVGPTLSLDHLLSSSDPDMMTIHLYPSPYLSLTLIVLLGGHS